MTAAAAGLEAMCRRRLSEESAFLDRLDASLVAIRGLLSTPGPETIPTALRLQAELARCAEAAQAARLAWRAEIATLLGLAAQSVRLSAAVERLPSAAARELRPACDRLRERVTRTTREQRVVAAIVCAHREALQRFFLDLTGAGAASGRYGPAGVVPVSACGTFVRARG